jgi:putative PIG3 family NAD(P)H quinone oxidoreductase
MRAIRIHTPGPQGHLASADLPMPAPGAGEVRLRVAFAGLNRADLFQVAGQYPAPEETAMVPGLEVSGTVEALGADVDGLAIGTEVCALLTGGGYAEYCTVPATQIRALPPGLSLKDAAGLPEALLTNWLALVRHGQVQLGERVLVTGGSSGIGSFAIPMLRELGVQPIALAHGEEKIALCQQLGAQVVDYRSANLAETIKAHSPQGVAVVLDMLGGPFVDTAMQVLIPGGRLVSIALLQGSRLEMNVGRLLMKNLQWTGLTLRSQSAETKAELWREAWARLGEAIAAGRLRPVLDTVFPLEEAEKAHKRMQDRLHSGKILLQVGA